MIYVIEDDPVMAECIMKACVRAGAPDVRIFSDAVSAMQSFGAALPALIFLDILLTGPDGFTFLNELVSYEDTARIPVVIISSLDLAGQDLRSYGVVRVLDKAELTPADIRSLIRELLPHIAKSQQQLPAGGPDAAE